MAANGLRRGESAVLLALAQGHSTDAAGAAGDVSGRTVRRWLEDDEFRNRVNALRREMLDRTVGQLADAATAAVGTLRTMLDADSEAVRVRAARAILAAVITLRESVDLEERIAALEDAQNSGDDL
ncbi:Uncharacterised protein [Mycobacterium tuberculosis]|nr:Uncharacterised protein [Mycobacterium tuberculosis]